MTDIACLSREHYILSFSRENSPALEVEPGTTLQVETRDAYNRQFRQSLDVDRYIRDGGSRFTNPATGPIYVRGVEPGDGLDVIIEDIELSDVGYVAAVPGIGVLGDTEIVPRVSPFTVRDGALWFEDRLRLPLRPMIGVIGVAPAEGAIACRALDYHGGNLDFNDITTGTTIHFPVAVPGALLALGDAHASIGYCEVHSGVNIDTTVRLRVERVPSPGWARPWFETDTEVMTLGVEDKLEDAIREATAGMVALLQDRLGVTYTEAIILTGAATDIRLGQAGNFGVKVSAYAVFPKASLPS